MLALLTVVAGILLLQLFLFILQISVYALRSLSSANRIYYQKKIVQKVISLSCISLLLWFINEISKRF